MVAQCTVCGAEGITDRLKGLCPRCLFQDPGSGAPDPIRDGRFGPLEIVATLGRGGMGTIYKARQPQLDRFVALKILSPALAADPEFRDRFVQEAQVLARLTHPHIVSIHDFGVLDGFYYLVMEYVEGANLRQILDTQALSAEELLKLVPPLCEALEYAHAQGVVHRDIKPENVLVDRKGVVKITDFGISKIANPVRKITRTGVVLGTPAYMAPEQTESLEAVDHRADLYSLGAIIYEILTGKVPAARFVRPSKIARTDPRMDVILERALARDPGSRFEKASQIREQVTQVLATPRPPVSRRWIPAVAVVLLLLILAVAGNLKKSTPPVEAVRQEAPKPPALTRFGSDQILTVLQAIEPNILEFSKRDLPADQRLWVVDWKFGWTSRPTLLTTLQVVITRRPSHGEGRDFVARSLLNYNEKDRKPADDRKPCLIQPGSWRVEIDHENLPWPEPTGYRGPKPDSEQPKNFWRYRVTLEVPAAVREIPAPVLEDHFKLLERRLPGLAEAAARDQVMTVYRDQIEALESPLKEKKVAFRWPQEEPPTPGKRGLRWELPTPDDFNHLQEGKEEQRVLREIEKRFWIRRQVASTILQGGVKVNRFVDVRFFTRLHEKMAFAPWEQWPSKPEEVVVWPGIGAGANGQVPGFVELDLPKGQGRTLTFGIALVLPYDQVQPFLKQLLSPDRGADRLLLEVAGCHATILEQQDPKIQYMDDKKLKFAELELNSFRIREKEKEITDPRLREVLAKLGPTTDEVLLAVTCRTYDRSK